MGRTHIACTVHFKSQDNKNYPQALPHTRDVRLVDSDSFMVYCTHPACWSSETNQTDLSSQPSIPVTP